MGCLCRGAQIPEAAARAAFGFLERPDYVSTGLRLARGPMREQSFWGIIYVSDQLYTVRH